MTITETLIALCIISIMYLANQNLLCKILIAVARLENAN